MLPIRVDAVTQFMMNYKAEIISLQNPQDLARAIRRMDSRVPKIAPQAPVELTREAATPANAVAATVVHPADAESVPRQGEDPVGILVRLRDQVLQHAVRIPKYTCVELVRRDRFEPVDGRAHQSCETIFARRDELNFRTRLRLD